MTEETFTLGWVDDFVEVTSDMPVTLALDYALELPNLLLEVDRD